MLTFDTYIFPSVIPKLFLMAKPSRCGEEKMKERKMSVEKNWLYFSTAVNSNFLQELVNQLLSNMGSGFNGTQLNYVLQ